MSGCFGQVERLMQTSPEIDVADALQRVLGGETLAALTGVPQQQLEALYADSCACVDREDFDAAQDLLLYLVMHDPSDFRFQFGYGLCLHQLGCVADAAKHYGLAYLLDASDAGCAYRLGECHESLGDGEAAAEAFRTAIALCALPDAAPGLRVLAEAGLDRLNG
jgi:tetratricopeptide (TPR) repeat protein